MPGEPRPHVLIRIRLPACPALRQTRHLLLLLRLGPLGLHRSSSSSSGEQPHPPPPAVAGDVQPRRPFRLLLAAPAPLALIRARVGVGVVDAGLGQEIVQHVLQVLRRPRLVRLCR